MGVGGKGPRVVGEVVGEMGERGLWMEMANDDK